MILFHNVPKQAPITQPSVQQIGQKSSSSNATQPKKQIRVRVDGGQYADSDWSEPYTHIVGEVDNMLTTPTNLRVMSGMFVWNAVPNAKSYEVKQNDTVYPVDDTSVSVLGLPSGTYTLTVRAIAGTGYVNSAWADPIEYNTDGSTTIKLGTPGNLRVQGDELLWDDVENAENYEVEVNGESVSTVDKASFDISGFEPGEYRFRIKALGDDSIVLRVPSIEKKITLK